jgi:hypothetical protein
LKFSAFFNIPKAIVPLEKKFRGRIDQEKLRKTCNIFFGRGLLKKKKIMELIDPLLRINKTNSP